MTDLERAQSILRSFGPAFHPAMREVFVKCMAHSLAAARREGAEEILSSLSHPNRSALRENVRENLEEQYANIFGKRCSTDAARRLAECALETALAFLVRDLTPPEEMA